MALGGSLHVAPSVVEAHRAACAGETTAAAAIILAVESDTIVVREVLPTEKASDALWPSLQRLAEATPATPLLALIRPAGSGGRWTVISCIAEDVVAPKLKMRVATARDELKRRLGASDFTPDFQRFSADELTAAAFEAWQTRR